MLITGVLFTSGDAEVKVQNWNVRGEVQILDLEAFNFSFESV